MSRYLIFGVVVVTLLVQGLLTSVVGVGAVMGPASGGWLTESFGWRSVFWFTIPMSAVALVAGAVLLKRDAPMGKAELDIKGAGLFSTALGAFMVGLVQPPFRHHSHALVIDFAPTERLCLALF